MVSIENVDQQSPLLSQPSLNESQKQNALENLTVNSKETMERLRTQNFGVLRQISDNFGQS